MTKMIYKKPAQNWHESLILGNGRIGAAVYGGTKIEQIALNEETLWSGYPARTQKKMPSGYLDEIRELTKKKKYIRAMELTEQALAESEDTQMYVPFGNLFLEILGEEKKITDYHRQLDLNTAEVTVSYKEGENVIEKRCLLSQPDQIFVYQVRSKQPLDIRIWAEGGCIRKSECRNDILKAIGRCPGRNSFTKSEAGSETAVLRFSDNPEEMGVKYEGWGTIISQNGSVHVHPEDIVVKKTTDLTLYYAIRSSFARYNKHPELEGKCPEDLLKKDISVSCKTYDMIREEHLKEYQRYFTRVILELKSTVAEDKDLKERLQNIQKGGTDPGLSALLFHYGRYLLIASSRPGTQPANLQGIWNVEMIPPWFSDYTVNINTQMNYWMTGPCNLDEMAEPLTVMCREMLEDGRRTAKAYFDSEGVCCFHNVDIWRKTSVADGRAMWNFWPMGYAWLCRNLYDHYLFCMDENYLKEIYPILRENVQFCIRNVEETKNGLAFTPATSPENEFMDTGQMVSVSYYSENINAIIRNLLRDYLECCRFMGIHDELEKDVMQVLGNMVPVSVTSLGCIMEWEDELEEADIHHRHISHLYELHPGRGIGECTPDLKVAAAKTLERRGDEGTGWSLAWKILMWARLKEGKHVEKLIRNMFHLVDPDVPQDIHGGGIYPNLLCAHPPYQIDGNLGYTAGVAEMLVQSHEDEVHIFPALPPEWKEGVVKGLRARGNIFIQVSWKDYWIKVVLQSDRKQEIFVRIGEGDAKKVVLEKGKTVILNNKE